jgi:hypothetical protein
MIIDVYGFEGNLRPSVFLLYREGYLGILKGEYVLPAGNKPPWIVSWRLQPPPEPDLPRY